MSENDEDYYDDFEHNNNKTNGKGFGVIGIGIFLFFVMMFVLILLGSSEDNVINENNKKNINENNNQNDISIENSVNNIIGVIGENKEKDNQKNEMTFEDGTYQNITIENFTFSIPNYWYEEGSKTEYVQYYAEKDGKCAMLSISYPKETDENYEVSYKGLESDNDNMIKVFESEYSDGQVNNYETFESNFGVKGIVYDFSFTVREFFIIRKKA